MGRGSAKEYRVETWMGPMKSTSGQPILALGRHGSVRSTSLMQLDQAQAQIVGSSQ
jgi:hypothetical protein